MLLHMVAINLRAALFPPSTSVAIHPAAAQKEIGPPTAAAIASSAGGLLTVTDAGLVDGAPYVAWALVNGEHRYVRSRTATTIHTASGTATGTGNTTTRRTSRARRRCPCAGAYSRHPAAAFAGGRWLAPRRSGPVLRCAPPDDRPTALRKNRAAANL
jgi:hypothetical protein